MTRVLHALAALAAAVAAAAQAPPAAPAPAAALLRAAFAAATPGAPALDWLRHDVLARRAEWPRGLDPDAAFTLHHRDGRTWFGGALPLPAGVAVAGEFDLGTGTVQFSCNADGSDRWTTAATATPPRCAGILAALHLDLGGAPRTVDPAALLGHLAGAGLEGDVAGQQLLLGALQCGEVTLAAHRAGGGLRVQGRSGGGLIVPALLTWFAAGRAAAAPPQAQGDVFALRAYTGRDGDRAEAARQLQRLGPDGLPGLRAMLHADEAGRLSAIDGLVRLGAAAELPRIVAAAAADMPLVTRMVRSAARALWPSASAPTRDAALAALRRNPALPQTLAELLLDPVAAAAATPTSHRRWHVVAMLAAVTASLFGLWLRERHRLQLLAPVRA
ncbi:MAG: hypothetical protein AB7O97_08380 [Planctomycetota bacterium]